MNGATHLEPIERASVDELRGLQLERLKWSVRHAYENVEHYRRSFTAHGMTRSALHRMTGPPPHRVARSP